MAPSSPFDIAESSADYWKRQLTLEETVNLLYWISLLNSHSYCFCAFAIMLILLGKGWVYRSEWHWDRRSFLVEHPQQHILKLRKRINGYFLLVQFNTALQISVAETQEYLSISNPTQSLDSKLFGESLQRLENTTGYDLSSRHCPLTLVQSNEVMNFVSEFFASASLRHWYFYLVGAFFFFFPSKLLHRSLVSRQKQARTFLRITKRFDT